MGSVLKPGNQIARQYLEQRVWPYVDCRKSGPWGRHDPRWVQELVERGSRQEGDNGPCDRGRGEEWIWGVGARRAERWRTLTSHRAHEGTGIKQLGLGQEVRSLTFPEHLGGTAADLGISYNQMETQVTRVTIDTRGH